MTKNTTRLRSDEDYLWFTLTDRKGAELTTVEAALVPRGGNLSAAAWMPCTFVPDDGEWRTTDVVDWSAANLPQSSYLAYARAGISPETPATFLGVVYIR